MATPATTSAPVPGEAGPREEGGLAARIGVGIAAAVLLLLALRLPIWETRLSAPQYPEGLGLSVYGGHVAGDVGEIDSLNHYVGMRVFRAEDAPEMRLWVPTIALGLVAVVLATVAGRRWLGRLARAFVWSIPLGVLADIQFRLYQYGHDIDPGAALRIEPFTPRVIGPTKVLNFTAWSWPGLAVVAAAGAAAMLSFGPRLAARIADGLRS